MCLHWDSYQPVIMWIAAKRTLEVVSLTVKACGVLQCSVLWRKAPTHLRQDSACAKRTQAHDTQFHRLRDRWLVLTGVVRLFGRKESLTFMKLNGIPFETGLFVSNWVFIRSMEHFSSGLDKSKCSNLNIWILMSSQTDIWETSENPTLQPGTWPLACAYFVYCVCSCLRQASLGNTD